MLKWERHEDRRYYRAWLQRDLLGSICVFKSYGSLIGKSGKSEFTVCEDIQRAKAVLREIFKARKKQGYQLFPNESWQFDRSNCTPKVKTAKPKVKNEQPDLFSLA